MAEQTYLIDKEQLSAIILKIKLFVKTDLFQKLLIAVNLLGFIIIASISLSNNEYDREASINLAESRQIVAGNQVRSLDQNAVQAKSSGNSLSHCSMEYLVAPSLDLKLPYVSLSSLQGSGNTWTRHLLHVYTGLATGSLYNDPALRESGEFAVSKPTLSNSLFIKQKTQSPYAPRLTYKWHEFPGRNPSRWGKIKFSKTVMIIRNPFDAIVAQTVRVGAVGYFRNVLGMDVKKARVVAKTRRLTLEQTKDLDGFNEGNLRAWLNKWLLLIKKWISEAKYHAKEHNDSNISNYLNLLCYDRLQDSSTQSNDVRDAINFIGLKDPTYHRPECLKEESEGSFHRSARPYKSLDMFDEGNVEYGYMLIKQASELLVENGLRDCTEFFNYEK